MSIFIAQRLENLRKLASSLRKPAFRQQFIGAYVADTAFLTKHVGIREIDVPYRLLMARSLEQWSSMSNRKPLGGVAVLVPKNSIGLTLAKAIASSYVMGNRTLVYFPVSLKQTGPVYAELLQTHLENTEVITGEMSSAAFMRKCLKDPEIKAIVIYGDDAWIDVYRPLAEETQTKIIFEGPGNDPMIVFEDADLLQAVQGALEGGLNNGGQSCSALERFFVQDSCYENFVELLCKSLSHLKCGSADEMSSDVGPIASKVIFQRMQQQLQESVALGARLRCGGQVHHDSITHFPILEPVVLTECNPEMPVVRDETFGPVFPILRFHNEEDLLPMLDQTKYGLNACSYGTTPEFVKDYLESNHRNVYYNSTAASQCNLPTRLMDGGFRRSGIIWNFTNEITETTGRRSLPHELSQE